MTIHNSMKSKFLPLNEFHIVKLQNLDDASLRGAAKRTQKDREDIKHTTILNFICKSLGLKGGYAEYKRQHWPAITTFLDQHSLHHPGLFEDSLNKSLLSVTHHDIAACCFNSDRPLPKRVFTGAGLTWDDILVAASKLTGVEIDIAATSGSMTFDELLKYNPPASFPIVSNGHRLTIVDFYSLENLLGDQLVRYPDAFMYAPHPVSNIYFPLDMPTEEVTRERARLKEAAMLFARIIDTLDKGWLEILPFNDNLIFLKDRSGGFDFVIRGQKAAPFEHNMHLPFLKNADVPKSDDHYHFQRWLYFNHKGWLKQDRHSAELEHYQRAGTVRDYLGEDEVLRRYLIGQGRYQSPLKKAALTRGFKKVLADGKWLAVSDLINVEQFREFMLHTNELYARYRPKPPQQDSWLACNGTEISPDAPASVSWYDALAYVTAISKAQKLPVRLATEAEWLDIAKEIRDQITQDPATTERALTVRTVEKTETGAEGFWGTRIAPDALTLKQHRTREGVTFVQAIDIGEWLMPKGAAVNTLHLGAMNMIPLHLPSNALAVSERTKETPVDWTSRVAATRDRMSPSSSGAYKNMRIGFRMVYELEV